MNRRKFVKTAMGTGAGLILLRNSDSVGGAVANSAIALGWIGAGWRGTVDTKGLTEAGAKVVAIGDLFQERLDAARMWTGLEGSKCFLGLDAYKKVLDEKVDAMVLTTPPGFRPEQFKASIEAGKHVFMENPVAVDTWGCREVAAAGEQAVAKKLSVVVGLQRRYSVPYREAQRQIASGKLGTIVAGRAF